VVREEVIFKNVGLIFRKYWLEIPDHISKLNCMNSS